MSRVAERSRPGAHAPLPQAEGARPASRQTATDKLTGDYNAALVRPAVRA